MTGGDGRGEQLGGLLFFFLSWAAVLGDSVYNCSDHAGIFPWILL